MKYRGVNVVEIPEKQFFPTRDPEQQTQQENSEVSPLSPPSSKVVPTQPPREVACICRPDQTPWWKSVMEWTAVALAAVVALIYLNQLHVMSGQLTEMRGSSTQTKRLISLYREQLDQLRRQANDTHDLALAAKTQAEETKTLTVEDAQEAKAARLAANAAKQSAEIADQSLHISERAYLETASPRLNLAPVRQIVIPVFNYGHIPAQNFRAQIFEITQSVNADLGIGGGIVEGHWTTMEFGSIDPWRPGNDIDVSIGLPRADKDLVAAGRQAIIFAMSVTYSDGFKKDPEVPYSFCAHTRFIKENKTLIWVPCSAEGVIPEMKRAMRYPAHYEAAQN